jgi:hypothetical protein
MRMVEGVNSSMIYLIYFKKLCKCHNVPPPNTTIKQLKSTRSVNTLPIQNLKTSIGGSVD